MSEMRADGLRPADNTYNKTNHKKVGFSFALSAAKHPRYPKLLQIDVAEPKQNTHVDKVDVEPLEEVENIEE